MIKTYNVSSEEFVVTVSIREPAASSAYVDEKFLRGHDAGCGEYVDTVIWQSDGKAVKVRGRLWRWRDYEQPVVNLENGGMVRIIAPVGLWRLELDGSDDVVAIPEETNEYGDPKYVRLQKGDRLLGMYLVADSEAPENRKLFD